MTARWVVEQVRPERDVRVTWQPISLLFKNDPEVGSMYYEGSVRGHRMLRVMEAIRAAEGDDAVERWYWRAATGFHHDGWSKEIPDLGPVLAEAGFDPGFAAAADDAESWDAEIRRRMDIGLALVGENVGTPIIAFDVDGATRGIFGPVMTSVPEPDQALAFWDAMVVFATHPGFWELKRTRTEGPDVGERPDV